MNVAAFTLLSRLAAHAGLVPLRQTFVRRCQNYGLQSSRNERDWRGLVLMPLSLTVSLVGRFALCEGFVYLRQRFASPSHNRVKWPHLSRDECDCFFGAQPGNESARQCRVRSMRQKPSDKSSPSSDSWGAIGRGPHLIGRPPTQSQQQASGLAALRACHRGIITTSATEILRNLRKPQVRQGRPCGGSSRTRTHSGKATT